MGGMYMGPGLQPLSWHAFFHTWEMSWSWTVIMVAVAAGYGWAWVRARVTAPRRGDVLAGISFLSGAVTVLVAVSSAVEAYSQALYADHVVQQLLLIIVAPVLIVLGRPFDVLARATERAGTPSTVRAILASRPASALTDPFVGLAVYAAVIVDTHLTPFMDQMIVRPWLHEAEHVVDLVGGLIFLIPLIGNAPVRRRLPLQGRLGIMLLAMVPNTVAGVVLMRTDAQPFPIWARTRPEWVPDSIHDVNVGGAIMWGFGNGLLMMMIVAAVVAFILDGGVISMGVPRPETP